MEPMQQIQIALEGFTTFVMIYAIGGCGVFLYRNHSYLYSTSDHMRALENWVSIVNPFVRRMGIPGYKGLVRKYLNMSAMFSGWDEDQFIGLQLLAGSFGLLIGVIVGKMLSIGVFFIGFFLCILGLILPLFFLRERAMARHISCNKDLPFFIDYIALAMGAGLDFTGAMEVVVKDAPDTPLKEELSRALRNMRLGLSREEALMELSSRMQSSSIKNFVHTLVQAMKLGSDVAQTLEVMSESLQTKRFQRAEEAAGKISVKMMIPVMLFVFPATIMILVGPMILEWIYKFGV